MPATTMPKQIADIQDLASRGVDLLIVSANTEKALDPALARDEAGHPRRHGGSPHRVRQVS